MARLETYWGSVFWSSGGTASCVGAGENWCYKESVMVCLEICSCLCTGHGAHWLRFLCWSDLRTAGIFCAVEVGGLPGVSVIVRLGFILWFMSPVMLRVILGYLCYSYRMSAWVLHCTGWESAESLCAG